MTDLSRLVDPSSVAIVGASDRPFSLGQRAVDNLLDHSDFRGNAYLINRSKKEIHGRQTYQSVLALPEVPDVAVLLVPAANALPVIEECASAGVKFAVVLTSGFGEMGPEGKQVEAQMLAIAQSAGMRLYGPNSPGLCNINKRIGLMFSPSFRTDQFPGPIGLATQGGGIGRCFVQGLERGVGVGLFVSTGNEVDLTLADFIRYMADADDITTIATAIEGVKNGSDFASAALYAAEKGKPVVALKIGRSDYGAKAVASHTGSLSGAAEVTSAALREIGVTEVDDMDELLDVASVFARSRPTGREKVVVYGFSGGACALSADVVSQAGLELATLAESTKQRLAEVLPDYAAYENPVDATSDILTRPEIGLSSLEATVRDPGTGVVFYPFPCDYDGLTGKIAEGIVEVQKSTDVLIVPVWMSDRLGPGYRELVAGGLMPIGSVQRGMRAVRRWIDRGNWSARPGWQPLPSTRAEGERAVWSEPDAKRLLASYGVPVPRSEVVGSADKAAKAADGIAAPVALKVVSAGITHKSDVGGVLVGLTSGDEAREGYQRILGNVAANQPGASVEGVLVEQMAPEGIDVLIGVARDPVFGPVITFGLGGVLVELLNDVSRRLLPLDAERARQLVGQPKCAALLRGVRGHPGYDTDALVRLLVSISDFVSGNAERIDELELNPVRVGLAGQGALALDAVLVTAGELGVAQ